MLPISVFGPQPRGPRPVSSTLLIAPNLEPVSLAEAKAWLKIDSTDEDGLIAALITAARLSIEAASRRLLISQTWRLTLDAWPADGVVRVQLGPFQTLVAARSFDVNGVAIASDPARFIIDRASQPVRITTFNYTAPLTARPYAGIEFDLLLGYGPAASDVPQPLRQAILLLVALWFENRGDGVGSAGVALPPEIQALISPFRRLRI